jgi:hypothetical protein
MTDMDPIIDIARRNKTRHRLKTLHNRTAPRTRDNERIHLVMSVASAFILTRTWAPMVKATTWWQGTITVWIVFKALC